MCKKGKVVCFFRKLLIRKLKLLERRELLCDGGESWM